MATAATRRTQRRLFLVGRRLVSAIDEADVRRYLRSEGWSDRDIAESTIRESTAARYSCTDGDRKYSISAAQAEAAWCSNTEFVPQL